jgi:hypothetical protein
MSRVSPSSRRLELKIPDMMAQSEEHVTHLLRAIFEIPDRLDGLHPQHVQD